MNICFVTSRFPFPTTKGDTLRAYNQIRELSRHHSVHLISATESDVPESAFSAMREFCSDIDIVKIGRARSYATIAALGLGSRLPLQVLYFAAPQFKARVDEVLRRRRFDVIHALTIRVAPAVFTGSGVPVVVDFMDSFAANISTRRQLVGPLKRRVYDLELKRVTAYERKIAREASGGVVIAQLDRDAIHDSRLAIIPNGVDRDAFGFYDGERDANTLVFTGNMGYQPNVDAVTWFAADCWPELKKLNPDLRFQIVGARPTAAVLALARLPGVEVTGRVDSIVPFLQRATVAVCPIRCGSGMQNKLLEAMSAGTPVVTTEFANRGIGAVAGRDVQVAADAVQFVGGVQKLLLDSDLRGRQAHSASVWLDSTYGWAQHATALVEEYIRAIDSQVPTALEKAV